MNDEDKAFDNSTLDEIIQLTRADHDSAGDLAGQGRAAADLAARVSSAITEIAKAAENISGPEWQSLESFFAGFSAGATVTRVRQLSETTVKAGDAIAPQSGVFSDLSQRAIDTHNQVDALRVERQGWLERLERDPEDEQVKAEFGGLFGDDDPASLRAAIRDRYDSDARGVMTSASSGYLDTVNGLDAVPTYDGPRTSRPSTGRIEANFEYYDVPGPTLRPDSSDSSASSAPPASPPPGPADGSQGAPPAQPELQTPGTAPAPAPAPAPTPVGDVYQPVKPVVPPVIGGRGTGPVPGRSVPPPVRPSARPTTTPSALGGQRGPGPARTAPGMGNPSMGSRPTGTGGRTAPLRQPDGLSRPVIGSRGTAGPGTAGAGTGRGGGLGRPNGRGTGTGPAPGVRSTRGPAPDGLSRPVVGGRGGTGHPGVANDPRSTSGPARNGGVSRPVAGGRGGTGHPGIANDPRSTSGPTRTGGRGGSVPGANRSPSGRVRPVANPARTDGLSRPVIGGRGETAARAGLPVTGERGTANQGGTGRPAISGRVANGSDRTGPRTARPALNQTRPPIGSQPNAGVRIPSSKPDKQPKPLLSRDPAGDGPEPGVRAPRTRPHDPGGHIIGHRRPAEPDDGDEPGFDWSRG